jgi:hypothetical protein
MDERPASATAALDSMRDWDWRRCDPDGVPFHPGKDLNSVASRLAMEGVRRPQDAILTLLCQGALMARGDYRWRKYQDFDHFQNEVHCEPIKPQHWQRLAASIQEGRRGSGWGSTGEKTLQLSELGITDCPSHEWEYGSCRFSYAVVTDKLAPWDDDYLEEWFSAWDIDVWPDDLEPIIWDDEPEPETAPPILNTNKGGRPPAADWELAALEIAGRYYRGDFKPQTIADVGRELASWLGNQDLHPSDSVVRIHAKRIFDAFQAWEHD